MSLLSHASVMAAEPVNVYKSLVRPKLDYCSKVWDPKSVSSTKEGDKTAHRLVDQLEMVQRRAARWVKGRYRKHIQYDRYATQPGLEDSRAETCRFKAVYASQEPKQHCSNRRRQIFTKRHREKITSISSDQSSHGLHSLFLLSPDYHTMESTPQSDMPENLARNLGSSRAPSGNVIREPLGVTTFILVIVILQYDLVDPLLLTPKTSLVCHPSPTLTLLCLLQTIKRYHCHPRYIPEPSSGTKLI